MKEPELKALISLLDDSDLEVFSHIEEKLISIGSNVIPLLEDAWSNAFDPVLQQRIASIVHKIQFDTLLEQMKLWIHTGNDDLLEGVVLVARYQYPELDKEKIAQFITQIKKDIWLELNESLTALEQVNVLNHIFFTKYGFGGNTSNYHAPQNSYINCVVESRKGNPLALSVLYLLVTKSLGLPIYGVNLPEHFILTYLEVREGEEGNTGRILFYINPFSKGSVFGKSDIDQFIKKLNIDPQNSYYQPCSHRDMVLRMLRNLAFSYQKLGDTEKVEELNQMIALFNAPI
ncbi:MAG: transglutaminase family protein [Bacteroidia bacterium]|nr:transglutaminase family protein [Bacteroidia bacterium]